MTFLKHLKSAEFIVRTGMTETNQEFHHNHDVSEVTSSLNEANISYSVEHKHDDTMITTIKVSNET